MLLPVPPTTDVRAGRCRAVRASLRAALCAGRAATIHGTGNDRSATIVRGRTGRGALCAAVCAGVPTALPDLYQLGPVQMCDRGRSTTVLPAAPAVLSAATVLPSPSDVLPAATLLPGSSDVLPVPLPMPVPTPLLLHRIVLSE